MTDIVAETRDLDSSAYPSPAHYAAYLEGLSQALADEIERLRGELFARGAMNDPPCFVCEYNGPGYYQPDVHPCAAEHHKRVREALGE